MCGVLGPTADPAPAPGGPQGTGLCTPQGPGGQGGGGFVVQALGPGPPAPSLCPASCLTVPPPRRAQPPCPSKCGSHVPAPCPTAAHSSLLPGGQRPSPQPAPLTHQLGPPHPLLTSHISRSKLLRAGPHQALRTSVSLPTMSPLSRTPLPCLSAWKTPIHPSKPSSDAAPSETPTRPACGLLSTRCGPPASVPLSGWL